MERGGRRVTVVPAIMGSSTDGFPVGMLGKWLISTGQPLEGLGGA